MKKINDQGIVSIIFTMAMILIMTLVVLAMSHNSIKEQRQSLDRQLSDQAYYNAESGISDWVNYLYQKPDAPIVKDTCATTGFDNPPEPNITTDGNDKYTCVMYDKAPTTIEYTSLKVGDSKVVPITPANSGVLDKLTIKWTGGSGGSSGCDFSANTLTTNNTCPVGGMRIELIDVAGNPDRGQLRDNNFIAFMLPWTGSSGEVLYGNGKGPSNQGVRQNGASCGGSPMECTATITGINAGGGRNNYVLHISPLYKEATTVTVAGTLVAGGDPVRFNNAQYMLDVTGKSADVLRRVKVRLPTKGSQYNIDYTLRTADDICKLISIDTDTNIVTNDPRCL